MQNTLSDDLQLFSVVLQQVNFHGGNRTKEKKWKVVFMFTTLFFYFISTASTDQHPMWSHLNHVTSFGQNDFHRFIDNLSLRGTIQEVIPLGDRPNIYPNISMR